MRTIKSLGLCVVMGLVLALAMPTASPAQVAVGISVHIGPPALPVYAQPVCPGPGYIWTPGYWAYGPDGYYWVPGTWVTAPEPGFLWTPGYWGFADGAYVWHAGYWGPHVGFYGGINYGFGYTGVGFVGGEWRGRVFMYNRAVTNVNVTVIHNNFYTKTVVVNNVNRVSFNGQGGVMARPNRDEDRWSHERHIEARHEQMEHERAAREDRRFLASQNHGRPEVAATGRAGDFHGHNVVAAREDHHNDRADARHDARENRDMSRNDRPSNAGGHDRPETRPAAVRSNDRPQPRGEARGNPHTDHGAAQHAAQHENKPAHENKGEHGKQKP
jgi:WXXGXW repeat (2 copies)